MDGCVEDADRVILQRFLPVHLISSERLKYANEQSVLVEVM